ncbi:Protein CBG24427 [Caenorhabditis briggsae]|uniref:Protein CBG24427 n=1 Tax=Caenorhabditis briggsae TaxID=6238 RepID=A8WKP4_CAEBR|nr:Protein CBG24427 [Caenorhabditis briggsae]CAP21039.2 Protein CBG24427 [Caenorhabditis briggsae]
MDFEKLLFDFSVYSLIIYYYIYISLYFLVDKDMLPSWLLFSHLWNQPNENLTEDEGSAYSSSTTPSSSSTFVGVSAGGNKNIQKGPAQRSSEHIKRLLLDKRNRQKAKLTPKPAFLPGTAKCEQRHEEAIKHHQSSPVQNDIFLANLTSLNLFHPLVPNRAMPQEVPFRACNDMDLFCAWRQERCAISSRNAKLEWKLLDEDARKLWNKRKKLFSRSSWSN